MTAAELCPAFCCCGQTRKSPNNRATSLGKYLGGVSTKNEAVFAVISLAIALCVIKTSLDHMVRATFGTGYYYYMFSRVIALTFVRSLIFCWVSVSSTQRTREIYSRSLQVRSLQVKLAWDKGLRAKFCPNHLGDCYISKKGWCGGHPKYG